MRFIAIVLLAAAFAFIGGCKTTGEQDIIQKLINQEGFVTDVIYESREQQIEKENEKAKLKRTEPDYMMASEGGMIIIHINAVTIASANNENIEVIIEDMSGNEITRRKGRQSTPNYKIHGGSTVWWNFFTVSLSEKPPEQFRVFVYNSVSKTTNEHTIDNTVSAPSEAQ